MLHGHMSEFSSLNRIAFIKANGELVQGGQSRGQDDWVHGFPEPVKS